MLEISQEDIDMEELEAIQKRNLDFLETEGANSTKVEGVPILLPFTYELIQIFNGLYLQELLAENTPVENTEESEIVDGK